MWKDPKTQQAIAGGNPIEVVVDFCCFGTAWRKRTKLVFGNLGDGDLGAFLGERRMCTGKHGKCSFSGKKHIHLQGGARTTRAGRYPERLCTLLAQSLASRSFAECTYNK